MTASGVRARSLVAAIGLIAIVAGVPVAIVAASGPPPTRVASWHQVRRGLAQPITDHQILRFAGLVCWVLWLLFTIAVIIEAAALLRHRSAPSQTGRGLRVPGLQGIAGALLLSALLAFPGRVAASAGSAGSGLASANRATPPMTLMSPPLRDAGQQTRAAPLVASQATPSASWVPYTVVRYDSPWAIAERYLGNGLRWREILDDHGASLIDGQETVATPSGPAVEETARTIYPGQILLLPPDATGVPASAPVTPQPTSPPPTSPQPTSPPPTSPPPVGAPPVGTPPVSTVWAGSIGDVTSQVTMTPAEATRFEAPRGPSTGSPLGAVEGRSSLPPLSEVLLGAALMASATINVIGGRRVRQAAHARRGERIRIPDPERGRAETALRSGRRDHLVSATHRAVGALASDLARVGRPAPLIGAVLAHAETIEIVLADPLPVDPDLAPSRDPGQVAAPPPWASGADGRRWQIAMADIPSGPSGREAELLPTLVPIGRELESGAEVLLNLESAAVTSVSGDARSAAGLVHAAALALTGLPWAAGTDVVLVGFGELLGACRSHVRVVRSISEIAEELRGLAATSAERFSATGSPHVAAARLRAGGDGLTPTIIVIPSTPISEEIAVLGEVCRHDTAISALVAGDIDASRVLDTASSPILLPDLALRVQPTVLSAADLGDIHHLLDVALAGPVSRRDPPYSDLAGADSPRADSSEDAKDDAPGVTAPGVAAPGVTAPGVTTPGVTVNVLGPIEMEGGAVEFRRPHAKETVVYLALHPRGVAEHQLDDAIWPERHLVKATTRDPVVSAARTALGGTDRMPYAQGQGPDKRYRTTDQVTTDWDQFCRLHGVGRRTGKVGELTAALRLVRGRPFADVVAGPGYGWLHLEGHLHHMEAEIVDAADLAAEMLLGAGDPVTARWAANQGLMASPYTERLWVRLMAVADALGEAQEIERILVEMDRRLDLDGDYSQLHPDTITAYRRYSRRTRPPSPYPLGSASRSR